MRTPKPITLLVVTTIIALLPIKGWSADDDKTFSQAELDQIMAPVALYPDSLLSQILMASTYPDQVAEAAQWSETHPDRKGDDAVEAVQDEAWDPSVASLVAFPQVLAMMGDKPDWVKQMGDAFLADPEMTMDTIQGLRKKADEAGNLESNEQQTVEVEEASGQTVIKIEPADPQVVYVPAYNPTVVYGTWWWPAYPPFYWPPPPGYGFAAGVVSGIGFGIGIAITNSIWGGFDWYRRDVNINVNRYNNINVNRKIDVDAKNVSWKHNPVNRKGAPYADRKSREQFGQKLDGADRREEFRGRDAERDKAMAAMQRKGIDPKAGRSQLTGSEGQKVRDRVSSVDRQRTDGLDRAGAARPGKTSAGLSSGKAIGHDRKGRAGDHALRGLDDRHGARRSEQRGSLSARSTGSRSLGGRAAGRGGQGLRGGGGLRR